MEKRLGWVVYEQLGIGAYNPVALTPEGCLYVWEEVECPTIKLSDIKGRRFYIIDRGDILYVWDEKEIQEGSIPAVRDS